MFIRRLHKHIKTVAAEKHAVCIIKLVCYTSDEEAVSDLTTLRADPPRANCRCQRSTDDPRYYHGTTPRQLDTYFLKVFQYLQERIEKGTASDKEKMLFTMLEGVLTYSGDGTPALDRKKLEAFELELPDDVVDVGKIFGKDAGNPPTS